MTDFAISCICMLVAYLSHLIVGSRSGGRVADRVAALEERVDDIEDAMAPEEEEDDGGPSGGGEALPESKPTLRLVGGRP